MNGSICARAVLKDAERDPKTLRRFPKRRAAPTPVKRKKSRRLMFCVPILDLLFLIISQRMLEETTTPQVIVAYA
jgi:hypothetical protein